MKKYFKENKPAIFAALVLAAAILIAALTLNGQTVNSESDELIPLDQVRGHYSEVAEELRTIQEDNRLCSIIGAYAIINTTVSQPTKENVEDLVMICGCWYPDIVLAQYQLESNFGKSSVAKRNHNLFGMKKAFARKSVRCRDFDRKGYAIYNNWQLSVIDRIYWEEHIFGDVKPTREEYLAKIKRIYAEDENYIRKITVIAKDYSHLATE